LSEAAGRNRTVPVDHVLLQAARGIGVSLGRASASIAASSAPARIR